MDFSSFVSLLERRALFFSSVDRLGDPFEGAYATGNITRPPAEAIGLTLEQYGKGAEEYEALISKFAASQASMRRTMKVAKKYFCVNCWHMNDRESDAMWRVYASQGAGVAVHTTFERLTASLAVDLEDVHVGQVNYIDYDQDAVPEGNLFDLFLHKRKSFEHEREVRAVVWLTGGLQEGASKDQADARIAQGGLYVNVDLDALIQEVVVSPLAPPWFHELVPAVTARFGLDAPVRSSHLAATPSY